jgi:type IV pilus assembly protein PilO
MPAGTAKLGALRNRTMMLVIGGSVLILLIWFVAYFSPSGKHLSAINTQTQAAKTEQSQLNSQLARLRTYSKETGTLALLSERLTSALPPTTDIYDYITALSNAGSAANVKIVSIDPGTAAAAGPVSVIPISLTAAGTYDQMLAFIKALYALPRLTVISSLEISGGGTATSRTSTLQGTFSLEIFALPSAVTPAAGAG